jgi:hypothetical protein
MAEAFDAAQEEGEGREAQDEHEEGRRLDRALGEPAHGEAAAAPGGVACGGERVRGSSIEGDRVRVTVAPRRQLRPTPQARAASRRLILSRASRCMRVAARALTSEVAPEGVSVLC